MSKHDGKPAQLIGQTFGLLTVLHRDGNFGKAAAWRCRCACGNELRVRTSNLTCGNQKSCHQGHKFRSFIKLVAAAEYRIWGQMKTRCYNPRSSFFKNYGGRGIQIHASWRNSFEQFLSDMGPRPSPLHTIDRYPDNDGPYEPGNCRWATVAQQNANTRKTVRIEIDGKLKSLAEHSQSLGLDTRLIRKRIRRGWSLEEAITKPRATWLYRRSSNLKVEK